MPTSTRDLRSGLSGPKPPIAFLPLCVGVRPGMSFAESSRLTGLNAGAWLMISFGGLFVIMNALQGSVNFVALNLAFVSAGATTLWLAAAGFHRTALTVLSGGSCLVFFVAAIVFRNGMENYLLVTMAASILLLDRPATRIALAGLNGAAFLYAKLRLAEDTVGPILPTYRYALNILLFLLALAGIIEFFRVLDSDYLRSLETKNAELDSSNKAKERLFSVIAHDLRGPVGNLKTSLDMLGSGSLAADEFAGIVSDLAADIDKSYDCLENLLSWSATQLGGIRAKPEPQSLREAVDDAVRLSSAAMGRKQQTLANFVPEDATVLADHQQLHAITRNLLSNAVKFTGNGGRIELSAARTGDTWTFAVTDTGVGMPAEKAASLFSGRSKASATFGTDAEKGLGLGLEICREFVALNNGKISAQSQPGKGTQIKISLLASDQAA